MNTFAEKSHVILELPAVLELLAQRCVSDKAKEQALNLRPMTEPMAVSRALDETSAACYLQSLYGLPTFSNVKDVSGNLHRAALGGVLSTRELLDISSVLNTARRVKSYLPKEDNRQKTCIDFLFSSINSNKNLEDSINNIIISEEEIADSASKELADIRRKMRAASASAREALSRIISSPSYKNALQDSIITTRSGRFVVPVKADHRSEINGLVHDISSSGATLFIEPMAAVKANNELKELSVKESHEIEKILYDLSSKCAACEPEINLDIKMLVMLDFIFAKARLSYDYECIRPTVDREQGLILKNARHPLLDRAKAVPISISLGREFDTVIITGPNTGGKTVSLKTMGLLSLMCACGLHIPSDDGSNTPIFNKILADIGDEQSIIASLSTFSAHMTNIVQTFDECTDNSLLLFDELGAGTDPSEGAALAVEIIEHARKKGAVIAATTHYNELKIYASNEKGVLNASCEFDVQTLKPTYRLLVGIPGKSNAFAISKRLGLSDEIITAAANRVGTENIRLESTIQKLETLRSSMEAERSEIKEKLRTAEEDAKKAARLRSELEVRLEKAEIKSKREAERIIADARATAEEVFKELDEMRSRINEEAETEAINNARTALRHRLNQADSAYSGSDMNLPPLEEKTSVRGAQVGDEVEIKTMGNIKAVVSSVSDNGSVTVQAGSMTITVKESDIYVSGRKKETDKSARISIKTSSTTAVHPELDLRGMESVDAVIAVDRYIDSARMARLKSVTIIHGKGTGALRAAVHKNLKENKYVKKYRLGNFGEGDAGVTVVELK